ncbi:MAG: type II secretion system protein GspE, partial [Armatimonadota bacterium]
KTGYRGRAGLFEAMGVSSEIRRLIVANAPAQEIRSVAEELGMLSLRDDARRKVLAGVTTVEEVIRVTSEAV